MNNIGVVYVDLGENEQARECFELALKLRREVGARTGEGKTLNSLGNTYVTSGLRQQAYQCFKAAANIFQEVGHHHRQAKTLYNLGFWYLAERQYKFALAYFLFAQEIFVKREMQDPRAMRRSEMVQRDIDALCNTLGVEQFQILLQQVEPQVRQIVEEDLRL